MTEHPEPESKKPEVASDTKSDRLSQWEKIAPHIVGIIITLVIIIGMKMSGHKPGHVAVAMIDGAKIGLVGYFAGWVLTKLVFFILKRVKKQ